MGFRRPLITHWYDPEAGGCLDVKSVGLWRSVRRRDKTQQNAAPDKPYGTELKTDAAVQYRNSAHMFSFFWRRPISLLPRVDFNQVGEWSSGKWIAAALRVHPGVGGTGTDKIPPWQNPRCVDGLFTLRLTTPTNFFTTALPCLAFSRPRSEARPRYES